MKPWYIIYQEEIVDDGSDLGAADDVVDTVVDEPADPAPAPADKTEPQSDWAPDWRSKISADGKHLKTLELSLIHI